jgi:MYXO-CTERM domain-containing protein
MTSILRRKGRVLDALAGNIAALRRRLGPEDRELFASLRGAQARLASAAIRGPGTGDPDAFRASVDALEAEASALEEKISAKSASYRTEHVPVTVEAAQAALDPASAHVEIVQHHPGAPFAATRSPARYTAYVLRRAEAPVAIDLGEVEPIDRAVTELREAFAESSRGDYRTLARKLDERVMRPIRRHLGDARSLFVAPDGALSLLPLEALIDEDGHFELERFSFTYLTSGRDVLRFSVHEASRAPAAVFANPTFGAPPSRAGGGLRGLEVSDVARVLFTPLPATASEGSAIAGELARARLSTGTEATKEALFKMEGARILHIATHGFFLGESGAAPEGRTHDLDLDAAEAAPPVAAKDLPMLRSGLAFAGANAVGEARASGILTALEATGLRLDGTKLVVLSACETGLGRVRVGDGVLGLRRALVLAGAETLVMSLWKVDDDATRDLMVDYYHRLEAGEGRAEALRKARLAMLASPGRSHPFYWASFIVSGDPSPLDAGAPRSLPPAVPPGSKGCACRAAGETNETSWAPLGLGALVLLARRRGRH